MSKLLAVVGSSGTGKSTSIESLDPKETFIINVVGKDLPFRGSRSKYNKDNKNYYDTKDPVVMVDLLKKISEKKPQVKNVIIDDFQYIMATEFIERAMEKGYDKWSEMAQHLYAPVSPALHQSLRDDLNVVVLHHEEQIEKNYKSIRKMKTSGKLIDQHITLEGLFTIVLFTEVFKDDEDNMQFRFRTVTDGECTAKSPRGMFEEALIPNDLKYVFDKVKEYYGT